MNLRERERRSQYLLVEWFSVQKESVEVEQHPLDFLRRDGSVHL